MLLSPRRNENVAFLFCDIPTLYHSQLTAVKMRFLLSSISGCNVGSGSQAIHHFRNEKEAGAVTWDRENKLVNSASSRLVFTSDGVRVGVGVVSGVVRALMTQWKSNSES